jgi:hypothetical protein
MERKMMNRYSVYCAEELEGFEVNTYLLTQQEAFKMASELFAEGKEEVTIVNMESHIAEQESNK